MIAHGRCSRRWSPRCIAGDVAIRARPRRRPTVVAVGQSGRRRLRSSRRMPIVGVASSGWYICAATSATASTRCGSDHRVRSAARRSIARIATTTRYTLGVRRRLQVPVVPRRLDARLRHAGADVARRRCRGAAVATTTAQASTRFTDARRTCYLDLGTWGGFTPYVGAGVGASLSAHRADYLRMRRSAPRRVLPSRRTGASPGPLMAGVSYQVHAEHLRARRRLSLSQAAAMPRALSIAPDQHGESDARFQNISAPARSGVGFRMPVRLSSCTVSA